LRSAADLGKITAALYGRGYRAEQLGKLLGRNLLRVLDEAQAEAAKE
jgi:microsomal dipeptidase-like Zn-dependent dipeptidase